jgi:hypothetical protein
MTGGSRGRKNGTEVRTPPASTRTGLMIVAPDGRPSTNGISSTLVVEQGHRVNLAIGGGCGMMARLRIAAGK